jgi:hypothetical protein
MKSWFGVTASLIYIQYDFEKVWPLERDDKPAHSVVFRLETFNPASIYVPTNDLNLVFEPLRDILTPRALRYTFGWNGNCLLRSLMVNFVGEAEFVGAFD